MNWFLRLLLRIGIMQRLMTVGDVRVMGLVAGTHVIEDIGRDVPHGEIIVISADQAFRSKDLWRGISQKCLAQLPFIAATPQTTASVQATGPDLDKSRLEAKVQNLETQLRSLSAENMSLKEEIRRLHEVQVTSQGQKLDEILSALKNGVSMVPTGRVTSSVVREEVADGSAPTFLPSQIKPKDVTSHIEIQGESAPSDLSSAAEQLRKLRKEPR